MDVCTIIARNYLPAARVLAASLHEHHPESRCHVLVIDPVDGYVDAEREPFEIVRPDDLEIPGFQRMAGIYEVLELSTAVKPWLMRRLLRDAEGIVYLDPDTRLYAPIDDVFGAVREHGLVLNPHNTEPLPRDGRRPSDHDILLAGAFNLGFIGLGDDGFAQFLLDWWSERLEKECVVDPGRGFFVDQRWIDLVPGLARDLHLVRDPGFNLAYWNLPTRRLTRSNGRYLVGDAPLRLFHFSGFHADRPHQLSIHQDRILLGDQPALAELCRDYARALHDAGFAQASKWPYGFAATPGGLTLGRTLRAAYGCAVAAGAVADPLFTPEGERQFLDWCNGPAGRGGDHGVTRYLELIHESRADLRAAYPRLEEPDVAQGFIGWANVHGSTEVPIPEVLLPSPAPAVAAMRRPDAVLPAGANVAGYLRAELGVGQAARQVIGALDAAGVPALPVGLVAPDSRQGHEFGAVSPAAAGFDVNIICVNADGLPEFARRAGPGFFAGRHSIGVWWWELTEFPDRWPGSFELVDELWAFSRFVADALGRVSPRPVLHLPMPLEPPPPVVPDRRLSGLPDGFVFLFSFDYNSVFRRKNPLGLLEAFTRAFAPGEGVSLVIKSINHERDRAHHGLLRAAAAAHPHVRLLDGYLSALDNHRLMAGVDAFASLHRSEGLGLGMAEALLAGKPVVATDYGGSTDFLTERTGFPVAWRSVPVGEDAWPYQPSATWAEPDLDDAARRLREVVEDPGAAAQRARAGADLLAAHHAPAVVGARMAQRLSHIERMRARDGAAPAPGPPALRAALQRIERGPLPPPRSPLGPAGRLARRAVLRLIRPYTAHADAIGRELARAVLEGDDRVSAARRSGALAQAELLAEMRRLRAAAGRAAAGGGPEAEEGALAARLEDLAGRVADLGARLGGGDAGPGGSPAVAESGSGYPEAPDAEPWSEPYSEAQRAFVARALDDAGLQAALREADPLPRRYGVGFDERVVEFPWVSAQRLAGAVLDAGSTLNHLHVLTRLRPRMDDLTVVTLSPEPEAFPRLGVSYLFADLRDLPLADRRYDRVVCLSTLEHVGMDNSWYGGPSERAEDPRAEMLAALAELRRVLRPGGDLYLTLPLGEPADLGWMRVLSHAEVDEVVAAFAPSAHTAAYYRYTAAGWQLSDRRGTTGARYRDHFAGGPPGPDRAVAARAVACLHLVS